jgi:hypothetical protein
MRTSPAPLGRRHQGRQPGNEVQWLSDVASIVLAVPEERAAYGFDTAGAASRTIKEMGALCNNLAHAQDIVTHDWAQIARIARDMRILAKENEG